MTSRAFVIKSVLAMWAGGRSSGEIANEVGISRNAVIGIVARNKAKGVEVDPKGLHEVVGRWAVTERSRKARPSAPGPAALKPLPLRLVEAPRQGQWVPLLDCDPDTCRYTDDGQAFCNMPTVKRSWCAEHFDRVIVSGKNNELPRDAVQQAARRMLR